MNLEGSMLTEIHLYVESNTYIINVIILKEKINFKVCLISLKPLF